MNDCHFKLINRSRSLLWITDFEELGNYSGEYLVFLPVFQRDISWFCIDILQLKIIVMYIKMSDNSENWKCGLELIYY